jgi:hypothetical protein
MDNAGRSFAYFIVVQNQFAGDIVQYLVMVPIVVFLYYRKELNVIFEFLKEQNAILDDQN